MGSRFEFGSVLGKIPYSGGDAKHSERRVGALLSLANDSVGYLPTDEILKQGAHESVLCPLNPIEAALSARVEAALAWAHAALDK